MSSSLIWRNRDGSSAAEFALVLPLLLILLFGIIDGGRFAWQWNRAEKATQAGVRVAVVTKIIPQGLYDEKYVGQTVAGTAYTQGDPILASALGKITCLKPTSTLTCSCVATPCPSSLGVYNSPGFDAIVARMTAMMPEIAAKNVTVEYSGSGVGYAGDPGGMDISPLVTVKLSGVTFKPITSLLFATVTMPDFATTLTAEDSVGSQSN